MSQIQRRKRRRRGRGRPRNKALLAGMVVGVFALLAGLIGVGYIVSIASSAPPLGALKARPVAENTRVFAADGRALGWIKANNLHLPLRQNEIPQVLKDATIAIEDERFYSHKGIDYEGLVRAAATNFSSGKTRQGGSTITMQLVRSLYISSERTYTRKIREMKLAEELEKEQSKEWILDKYLDSIPYGTVGGQSAIGVKAAARVYFSKDLRDLNLRESALLAGLPQATTDYSPVRNPGAAKRRRNEVLDKMAELGMISPQEASKAKSSSLGIKRSTYFTKTREEYFFDYVKDQLFKEYGAKTVREGGMKVYTTIDLTKQAEARDTLNKYLAGVGPSSAIVTINPKNGYIEAMASSGSYGELNFNLAAQGQRRPGSTFKVMALMAALRKGVDPDSTSYTSVSPTVILDPVYGRIETKTYGGTSGGKMSLKTATLKSDNSVYIQLALDIGPDEVARTAKDMGITSLLKGYPAETLGGLQEGVSPLDMAVAYASIASGGYRLRPTAIKKIKFPDGKVEAGNELPKRFRVKKTRIFSEGVAAKATDILKQNITSGTGTKASIGCPAGGKTGTTDNNTDAWFVGSTPRYTTSVWVGYIKDDIQMNGLYYGRNVDGGTFPAEIWGDYMGRIKGKFCGDFPKPQAAFDGSGFSGRYARAGRGAGEKKAGEDDDSPILTPDDDAGSNPDGEDGGNRSERGSPRGRGGDDRDGGGVDPERYQSAPAEPKSGADGDGGATAPP